LSVDPSFFSLPALAANKKRLSSSAEDERRCARPVVPPHLGG
jgi:hypothetical protein